LSKWTISLKRKKSFSIVKPQFQSLFVTVETIKVKFFPQKICEKLSA